MFEKAIRSLLHQTDRDGALIAVTRLNDSEKLKPLAVVIRCSGTWLWQRPKYRPTDFTLNDLLRGKPIRPVLQNTVFVDNFIETQNAGVAGSGEVEMPGVGMKVEGGGGSKILSSHGTLHKESVIMPHFLKDSKNRKVDLQHSLITQIQGKNQVFMLLKERIFTTCNSTIYFSDLKEGSAFIKIFSPPKVHLNNSICLKNARHVAIEIPKHTVLAYSVSGLHIKSDGGYEVGVNPYGIAADDGVSQDSDHSCTEVDGPRELTHTTDTHTTASLAALKKELSRAKTTLRDLSCLPAETRLSLLSLFQEILPDQELLRALEDELEKICDAPLYDSHTRLSEASDELVERFLKLLMSEVDSVDGLPAKVFRTNGFSDQNGGQSPPARWTAADHVAAAARTRAPLTALHLLISAAEELPSDAMVFLKTCSSETIDTLHYSVTRLMEDSRGVPLCELPRLLRDSETPQDVAQVFSSCNITLKRDDDKLQAEIGGGSQVLPLVLCVVIHGLALLNETCEIDVEI